MQSESKPKAESTGDLVPPSTCAFTFSEMVTPHLTMQATLNSILFNTTTAFQNAQVIDTKQFGKTLILDGQTQSSAHDEHTYHESLVHAAMLQHPNPKRVYIGGGGEFATAREVLKHKSVEKVIMVDIDEEVCNICRKLLPEWNDGAYEDPRLEVYYEDAHAYLREKTAEDLFDVIIMDIADPIEAGPGAILYTEEFYQFAKTKLSKGGVIVTQSGPGSCFLYGECFSAIHNTLKQVFKYVIPYTVNIPSFTCTWGFNLAFDSDNDNADLHLIERKIQETNTLIENRIQGKLYFYDGISHLGIFGVPLTVRQGIAKDERIIKKDSLVYMF